MGNGITVSGLLLVLVFLGPWMESSAYAQERLAHVSVMDDHDSPMQWNEWTRGNDRRWWLCRHRM
ncbi:hypothetical protein Poly24_31340 [Rosistilla carotiformis]|uniref:Uncharacterized protein n=1 Tax=Rosistilla carotiformis TaxID=2528017 RepID=A0A518JV66_9BACT|nr:hypothetical protein [Rosistilla carotiformis]QDV69418.1 hypothetical protein Poly24_31340 [Rosistilla carotiformis]